MPQPILDLLRQTYPQDFAQVPDIAVGDWFHRLMFKPASFTGEVKQGQVFRRQVLSDLRQIARQAAPGVVPEAEKEFIIWARRQALDLAPMEAPDIQAQREFSQRAFRYEQRFGDLAHPILFAEEFVKYHLGRPVADIVSAPAILAGVPREATQAIADALSPRIEFGKHVTDEYGLVAGLAYDFGSVLIGFGPLVGGTRALAFGVGALKIPLISRAAGAIARNEVAFITTFFGVFSSGAYNRAMIEQKREPDLGGFALNLAAGAALGYLFPKARRVFIEAKQGKRWTNEILLPMLEKRISDLKKMNRAGVTTLLADKGITRTADVKAALQSISYAKAYTGNLAARLLVQSTRAGALGTGVGAVAQATQGIPIDFPSLAQSAVMMMAFHAYGVIGAPKRLPKPKARVVPDATLRIGRDNDIVKDATRSFREQPDRPVEENFQAFLENLRPYRVERVEVEKDVFVPISEFIERLDLRNATGRVGIALEELARAELAGDRIMESRARGRMDEAVARVARAARESPTETPFSDAIKEEFLDQPQFADNPGVKKAQELYLNLRGSISRILGPDAERAFRTGLEGDQPLSARAAGEPVVAEILRRFPQAEAAERLFSGALRQNLPPEQYQALYDATRAYLAAPGGAIYPPGRALYEPPAVTPTRAVVPAAAPPMVSPVRPPERPAVERPPAEVLPKPPRAFILGKKNPVERIKAFVSAGQEPGAPETQVYRSGDWVVEYIGEMAGRRFFNLFKIGKSTELGTLLTEIDGRRIEVGGTVGDSDLRTLGIATEAPKPPVKPPVKLAAPPVKEKPKPIKVKAKEVPVPKVAQREVKALPPEAGKRLIDTARKIGPATGTTHPNLDIALSPETLPEVLEVAKLLGVKTRLEKPLELHPAEQVEDVNKVWHAIRKAVHGSTRRAGDEVETVYGPGRIHSYNPKTLEYEVFDYGTGRLKRVKWHLIETPSDKGIHKVVSDVTKGLTGNDVSLSETFAAGNRAKSDPKIYGGIPIDLSMFFRGKSKAKARQAFEKDPELAGKFMETARTAHSWGRDGDPFMAKLARFSVGADPKKLVTPKQWDSIQKWIKFNQDNPHMRGPGGSIDAADFMYAVLGRSNFHPELAREVGKAYEPLTRDEARLMLREFARISEAIRDRNWPLAMKVFLTSETKKYNPHLERMWDNLLRGMYEHNGLIAEGSRVLAEGLERVKNFRRVNPRTQTAEFREYSKKQYGYIWGNEKINPGKVDRWATEGRDFGDEVYGLLSGVISWTEPFVSSQALQVARSLGQPLKAKVPSLRDRWWYFFDRGLRRYMYPLLKGRLLADDTAFRDAYVNWKLQSEKTTPENADAMRARFEKEVDGIIANEDVRLETVTRMIDSKKLGKIADPAGRSRYYPQYDPKTAAERMLTEEEAIDAGRMPRGFYGEPVYMQHRKADVNYWIVKNKGKWDPVKDWNSYFQTVSNYIWRARVRAETWWSIKALRRDIAENPHYAQVFQKHVEIVESLRSNLLDRPDRFLHNLSQNVGFLASAIMLAHPKTVFRNYIGGHALTAIHNGLGAFGRAIAWRGTVEGRRILDRAGFEAAALFSEAASAHVSPRQMRQQIEQGRLFGKGPGELQFESRTTNVVRMLTSYALTRPVPFVTDLIPGLQKILKPGAFAGSEIPLREIAFSAGYLGGRDAVMNGAPRYDKVRRIYGNNVEEMAAKALKNYGEILIKEEILPAIVENPSKARGAKKYMLQIVGRETDAELRARAHRTGLRSGVASVTFTQFEYSTLNTPSIMRHPLGRIILLFRKYTWNRIAFANRIIKESFPQYGGGKTELGRLLRFAFTLSAAQALSVWVGLNFYRFVEDDVVSMLSSISDWFSGEEGRRRAFFGKPWWQFLSGAELSRMIDVITNATMPTWEKVIIVSHAPYGRATADAVREHQKVAEGRKNVFEALMNYIFGAYKMNYGGAGRRPRARRIGRTGG